MSNHNLNQLKLKQELVLFIYYVALNIKELKESFKYYREVIKKLTNRAKAINSIAKSKLDWKQYTTKEKLENQME